LKFSIALSATKLGVKLMEIYGHKQLSLFFIPLLQIHDDGFLFKNKDYSWTDIKHIYVWEPFEGLGALFGTGAIPRATIELSDGKKIKIHSSVFRKKGEKSKIGFWSGKSEAFSRIIDLFKEKTV
jgi:hypothetical protein